MMGTLSPRVVCWLGILFAVSLACCTSLTAQETAKKHPVPKDQTRSRDLIFDIFKEDLQNAKEPEAKSKLAAYFIQQGKESRDDLTNRYVLYIEATALAAAAGDAPLALSALDELAKDFDVDLWKLKATALAAAAENSPTKETSKAQVELLLPMIAEAVEADNYDAAVTLGKIADVAARKSKVIALVTAVQKRQQEVVTVQKGFARLQVFVDRLKVNAKDGEANLELGKYFAFLKARWERALPLLAMGSDETLRALANKDLAKPQAAKDQLALADGWWELAAKEKDPAQLALQRRARHWYEQAIGGLAGLNRTKAARRIDLVSARVAGTVNEGPIGPVGELKKLEGHTDEVKSVAFSFDGRYAISGSVDQTARIWDLATGKEDKVLRGHTKQIWAVAFHPNGRQVFTASWDATARLWDAKTGNEARRFSHRLDLNGLALSRDGNTLWTASDDQSVYMWNVATGDEIRRIPGHSAFVYTVALAPDGRRVASGSVDKTVRVVDLNTGQLVKSFEGQASAVTNVAFSPDSRYLFATGDNFVRQWEIATGKEVRRFEGHTGLVIGMALSPDGRRLLTGGDDKTIRYWDTGTGKELHKFTGHSDTVTCVAFSHDGRRALSGGFDRTVRLWGLPR
ncbi:MAG: WD40 repeat domain-containing protein [Gemmataceae bacterium]|nr:WD40 repeat domain-containing protein [Gemmataceae bacterium]